MFSSIRKTAQMEQTKRRACYEVLHALRPGMATIGRGVGSTLHRRVLRQVTKEGKVEADPRSLSHGSFHRAFLSAGGDLERAAT